ncbi:MAG TPA: methyltransferase domain-containing protein [Candidatus Paceibacterota bacterium]|nr:methyltransferase domain-containing protein [Candidatus Paceibacterota bacterium]
MHAHESASFAQPTAIISTLGIEPGMLALDVGAGSGHHTLALARAVGGSGRVYALDVQPDLLRRIKNEAALRGLSHVHTIHADIEQEGGTRLKDGLLDFALFSNILFQLEHAGSALGEARRVLKRSGRLALIDWADSFGGMGPQRRDVISRDKALDIAREAGFEALRSFDAGGYHWGVLMRPATLLV